MGQVKDVTPVGATWEARNKWGDRVTVWLDHMLGSMEVWYWRFSYSDGSTQPHGSGWSNTRRNACDQCKHLLAGSWRGSMMSAEEERAIRFKRVK